MRVADDVKLLVLYSNKKTGSFYTTLDFATHSETMETMVIYQDKNYRVWVRPLDLFKEKFERVISQG